MSKRAIILAAGGGTRLRPLTEHRPKCLVPVKGVPIIENALGALHVAGVTEVTVVVGHQSDVLMDYLGPTHSGMRLDYIGNQSWAATNSMFSLLLALDGRPADIILEGDVFFEPRVLDLLGTGDVTWLVDKTYRATGGSYLHCDATGRVTAVSIVGSPEELGSSWAKSLGILLTRPDGSSWLRQCLQEAASEGRHELYYDIIIGEQLGKRPVSALDVSPLKWFEIDTGEDLRSAEELFA